MKIAARVLCLCLALHVTACAKHVPVSATLSEQQIASLSGTASESLEITFDGNLLNSDPMLNCMAVAFLIKEGALTRNLDTILDSGEYPLNVGEWIERYPEIAHRLSCERFRVAVFHYVELAKADAISAGNYILYTFMSVQLSVTVCRVYRIPITIAAESENTFTFLEQLTDVTRRYTINGRASCVPATGIYKGVVRTT